ncbi:MAG: hypothetical protein R3B93_27395 [Bacteroidia bacterium]
MQNFEGDLTRLGGNNLLFPMAESSIATNNRDKDGFYEYVVMGTEALNSQAFVYRAGDQTEALPGFQHGDIVWVDYDDGDNDLVMTGINLQSNRFRLACTEISMIITPRLSVPCLKKEIIRADWLWRIMTRTETSI